MAYDKVVDSVALDSTFKDIADAIRSKGGTTELIEYTELAAAINDITAGDDVTEEVDEYTELLAMAIEKIYGKTLPPIVMQGNYVWEKYKDSTTTGSISVTQLNSGVNPVKLQLASDDIDLSKVDDSFFVGLTGHYGTTNREYVFKEGNIFSPSGTTTTYKYSYDPSTQIMSMIWAPQSIYPWADIAFEYTYKDERVFLVSDNPDEYPDGINMGGYWYKKIIVE